MRDVIPQTIMDALQDLPDSLQRQVVEYLQSLELTPPAPRGRGCPDVSTFLSDLKARRDGYDLDGSFPG